MTERQKLVVELQDILNRLERTAGVKQPHLICTCYQNITAACPIHHDHWMAPTTTQATHT